ncbi:3690_t:CDS:1 [Dentiscutata erythropus]|uniref:3690_t:CDS:1 n=1 Tax=Dentiscutata erythropus TaxID=1348616 RepID=A0A9N9ERP4_9GLOM|nr:3690_t:CDS:1 [Dentiscutata erythropus]
MNYLNKIGKELGNNISKVGSKLGSRFDIKYFLIDSSKINIGDAKLNIIIINALKNVLKICIHYGIDKDGSDRSKKLVKNYVDFINNIKRQQVPNDYIIDIANKYYKKINYLDIYKDKPLLKEVINNVDELFQEIVVQDLIRKYINFLDNEVKNILNMTN